MFLIKPDITKTIEEQMAESSTKSEFDIKPETRKAKVVRPRPVRVKRARKAEESK